jgi:hypothetical protein
MGAVGDGGAKVGMTAMLSTTRGIRQIDDRRVLDSRVRGDPEPGDVEGMKIV